MGSPQKALLYPLVGFSSALPAAAFLWKELLQRCRPCARSREDVQGSIYTWVLLVFASGVFRSMLGMNSYSRACSCSRGFFTIEPTRNRCLLEKKQKNRKISAGCSCKPNQCFFCWVITSNFSLFSFSHGRVWGLTFSSSRTRWTYRCRRAIVRSSRWLPATSRSEKDRNVHFG